MLASSLGFGLCVRYSQSCVLLCGTEWATFSLQKSRTAHNGEHCKGIGVRFRFSINPESGKLCYTSLLWAEKWPLCEKIDVIALLGDSPKAHCIQKLFNYLSWHNQMLRKRSLWTDEEIELFDAEAKDFMSVFLSIFLTRHVTPYMHLYANHISELLYRHRTLYSFLQEPIELNNHVNLSDFHWCTSKRTHGAMKQLVQKRCRLIVMNSKIKKKYFKPSRKIKIWLNFHCSVKTNRYIVHTKYDPWHNLFGDGFIKQENVLDVYYWCFSPTDLVLLYS